MAESDHIFRIHPAIGVARFGNSAAYYLAPETMVGLPVPGDPTATGGLPIRPGTERDMITSAELRDRNGAMKRQAARFRIFHYSRAEAGSYPCGAGTEIKLGSMIDGKCVVDIIWTAHIANKKANSYVFNSALGVALYEEANAGQLKVRNPWQGEDLGNATRLKRLVIDPGPRAIRGIDEVTVRFDKETPASFCNGGAEIKTLNHYPKSFPDDHFARLYTPAGKIETLGELETDDQGRLVVLGGYGKACAWYQEDGTPYPLVHGAVSPGVWADLNENGWFDDSGDGSVSAVLVFDDASVHRVHPAWVVTAPPSLAPQIRNIVSLWDDIYDTWVRKLNLCPEMFWNQFRNTYEPSFEADIYPIFRAVALQRWTTNLPEPAVEAHDAVGSIKASDDAGETILAGLAYIRDPNNPQQFSSGAPFMPLVLGDVGKPFLAPTLTQFFLLTQWSKGHFRKNGATPLGTGEFLDKAAMVNCVGGGLGPGIEITFIVRDPDLYQSDWGETGAGPFRIRARHLDYDTAQSSQPFLTIGYVPFHPGPGGVLPAPLEPGDATKFMSLPWHTDFNACATHNTEPNPRNSTTLYWAWPAQRPVHIYRAADVHADRLGPQHYSMRGKGTHSDDLGTAGRYQEAIDFILRWHKTGIVLQGSAIVGGAAYSPLQYLEVASQLDEEIRPWPMNSKTPGA
jgi:hypothetical protein